ncbi:unnamed protein product, partial [Phaeothamnion confervicola]
MAADECAAAATTDSDTRSRSAESRTRNGMMRPPVKKMEEVEGKGEGSYATGFPPTPTGPDSCFIATIHADDGGSTCSSHSDGSGDRRRTWESALREVGIVVREGWTDDGEWDGVERCPVRCRRFVEASFERSNATAYLALVPVDDDEVVGARILAHIPGDGGIRSSLERQGKLRANMQLTRMNDHPVEATAFSDILTLLKWGPSPGAPLRLRFEERLPQPLTPSLVPDGH